MGTLGCILSIVAGIFAVIGLIPLLGWVNWFTTLPAALLAILFGLVGLLRAEQRTAAALALTAGVVLLVWTIFRLAVGGGFV